MDVYEVTLFLYHFDKGINYSEIAFYVFLVTCRVYFQGVISHPN